MLITLRCFLRGFQDFLNGSEMWLELPGWQGTPRSWAGRRCNGGENLPSVPAHSSWAACTFLLPEPSPSISTFSPSGQEPDAGRRNLCDAAAVPDQAQNSVQLIPAAHG